MFGAALQKTKAALTVCRERFAAIEPYKVSGGIILALLSIWVIGMIGDSLVQPRAHKTVAVAAVSGGVVTGAAKKKEAKPLEAVAPLLASAKVDAGQSVFKKCKACHTAKKGGANRIGPNLWNIVNAKRGAATGFSYSKALPAKEGAWNYESLNAFLAKPKTYIPGTKMAFAGLKKTTDRANLIAYLRSLSDSPAPLP